MPIDLGYVLSTPTGVDFFCPELILSRYLRSKIRCTCPSSYVFINRQQGQYQGLSLPLPVEAYTISEEIPKGTFCEKGETYMSYVAIIDVYDKLPAQLRKYFMALRESGEYLAVFV